jgi:arylsulfatase A-like enzyme
MSDTSPKEPAHQHSRRPNIIWVFGDQHRGCATGYAGDPNLHTPNLDRLASEGTVFRNAVAGTPLCSPFRGSLLTSRYPHECVPGHQDPLPDGMPTVADTFNKAGYETAWFGKWHIDGARETKGRNAFYTVPRERRGGFKQWIGYENNLAMFDSWVHGHEANGEEVSHTRLEGYETDALTDLFIDYLEQQSAQGADSSDDADSPFFAALSVIPPHNPFVAPEEWMTRHTPGQIELRPNVPPNEAVLERARRELAGYYAMIENLDHNLGRIREALYRLDQYNNTIIVFFSDHGDMMGSHGQFRKTSIYHESLNIPFIMGGGVPFYESDGLVKPQVLDYPINHVDIPTTSLGLCGIPVPEDMAGYNYAPQISWHHTETQPPPESAFLQYCAPSLYPACMNRPWRGVVTTDGWKYGCFEGQPWVLFNRNEDPWELCNLAHYKLGNRRRMVLEEQLADWIARTGDKFTLPEA